MEELLKELKIEDMIHEVRGKQVIMDFDLAKLYACSNSVSHSKIWDEESLDVFVLEFP